MNRLSLRLNSDAIHVVEHANKVILRTLLQRVDRVFPNTHVGTAEIAHLPSNKALEGSSGNNRFHARLLVPNLAEGLRMKAAGLLLGLIHF